MLDGRYFLDDLWRRSANLPEEEPRKIPSLESLQQSEWSHEFERHMRIRLIMGAIRYGCINEPGKPIYDRCASIRRRIDMYESTGNQECLIDIANICLVEFEEKSNPKAHMKSTGDDGDIYHDNIIK